jgi:hypothetical protein
VKCACMQLVMCLSIVQGGFCRTACGGSSLICVMLYTLYFTDHKTLHDFRKQIEENTFYSHLKLKFTNTFLNKMVVQYKVSVCYIGTPMDHKTQENLCSVFNEKKCLL